MEVIDRLEHKIKELVTQLEFLKKENAELTQAMGSISQMRSENTTLLQEIESEKQLRADVNSRIEKLLESLNQYE